MSFEVGQIANLPYLENNIDEVNTIVKENIAISKQDWDSFETSWDYKKNSLL